MYVCVCVCVYVCVCVCVSGEELNMARAVQGAACGGMTLMSDATAKLVSLSHKHM